MANGKSPISNLYSLISRDALAILFLLAFPFIYFWQVTLGQSVWLTTDILRLFYPFGVELSRALNEGRLPLWTPNLLAGFPLLGEGQVGALYPINLFLYKFLPTHHALSYNILLHIAWAGCGMYVFARARGIGIASALLAGFVFSFNGVVFGQMFHPPILFAVAWLPWLIFLVAQFQTTHGRARATWFALAALALGVQFLCGSAQMAFLNALAVAVFGVFGTWLWGQKQSAVTSQQSTGNGDQSTVNNPLFTVHRSLFTTFLLLALGSGLAAIQLLPTSELIGYSVRGKTLGEEFVTSYSMPPEYLAQFVLPFAQGEPAEGNEEYRAYFGLAPLLLALGALAFRRNRRTILFAMFALGALSLALGELNPLYQVLYRLPVFSFFRVPARYLYLFVFAAAFLSAMALDALVIARSGLRDEAMTPRMLAFLFFALLTFGAIALTYTQPLEFWLDAWRGLPIALAVATLGVFALAWTRKIARGTFTIAILGLTIFDLISYAPPFLRTIDAITPTAGVTALPRSVQALGDDLTRGRVFTDDSTFPSPPALRNSLFPNVALLYDQASAQVYSSLAFGRHQAYVYNASPAMLDLLNVRYVMIPLEPRPQTKSVLPINSLGLEIVRGEIVIEPTSARALQVVSTTERAADLPSGTLIAEIILRFDDGAIQILPLRVGMETADWDYERKRVENAINQTRPPIARSFPAYWRAFGRAFEGHVYLARYDLSSREIVGVSVRLLQPDMRLLIESVALETKDHAISLARLTGKNDYALAYMSDTVAAWENRGVLARAFVVHAAQTLDDGAAFARMHELGFDPARIVLLSDETGIANLSLQPAASDQVTITESSAQRVSLVATTDQRGYLVLTDSWYPGWRATVDGKPAAIERADVLFRAVALEPGTHSVVFEYCPELFLIGAMISAASCISLIAFVGMNIGRAK